MKKVYAIRGATTINSNTEVEIKNESVRLIDSIVKENGIAGDNIVSVFCSTTADITAAYPVRLIRESGDFYKNIAFFSSLEPQIKGGLRLCIRLLVNCYLENQPKHIYLNGAKALRPDLEGK